MGISIVRFIFFKMFYLVVNFIAFQVASLSGGVLKTDKKITKQTDYKKIRARIYK